MVFFKKIAAFCGGVYDFPFYKMTPQIAELIKSKTADANYAEEFIALTSKYVASDEEWKSISPVVLIDKFSDTATEIYIWAGRNDRHPNFEGNKLVADKAKAKKLHVTWVGSDGGHCTGIDSIEIANFLSR